MKTKFHYSDLHCHPNLKTFGHSFDKALNGKQDVWYCKPPNFFTKLLNVALGITRFSQADFSTLSKAGAKIVFASLYPFEKGFFVNAAGRGPLSAHLSNLITDIGYNRIRHLQEHIDYFKDLENEYSFFVNSPKSFQIGNQEFKWNLISDGDDLNQTLSKENEIAVILSIEGAHVFNSGLANFGKSTVEEEVLGNIRKVKKWQHPPCFITFAHNFYNDFCGHAESLEPIRYFVDQTEGINSGFTRLGKKVLHELISSTNGRPIFIDIKHMSLTSRIEYFKILEADYGSCIPPTIVSHGAVNGLSINTRSIDHPLSVFYHSDINFFDEEIEQIGKSGGLFAIQFDTRRIAKPHLVKKSIGSLFRNNDPSLAAEVIWQQIKYIAEVLDKKGLFGWGTACIGSDYDGTINPLPGIWTAENFSLLPEKLLYKASDYLKKANPLVIEENKTISPEEIIQRFLLENTKIFLERFY